MTGENRKVSWLSPCSTGDILFLVLYFPVSRLRARILPSLRAVAHVVGTSARSSQFFFCTFFFNWHIVNAALSRNPSLLRTSRLDALSHPLCVCVSMRLLAPLCALFLSTLFISRRASLLYFNSLFGATIMTMSLLRTPYEIRKFVEFDGWRDPMFIALYICTLFMGKMQIQPV